MTPRLRALLKASAETLERALAHLESAQVFDDAIGLAIEERTGQPAEPGQAYNGGGRCPRSRNHAAVSGEGENILTSQCFGWYSFLSTVDCGRRLPGTAATAAAAPAGSPAVPANSARVLRAFLESTLTGVTA